MKSSVSSVEFLGPFLENFRERFKEISSKNPRKSPDDIFEMTFRELRVTLGLGEKEALRSMFQDLRIQEFSQRPLPPELPLQHRPSMPVRQHSSELDAEAIEYASEQASH